METPTEVETHVEGRMVDGVGGIANWIQSRNRKAFNFPYLHRIGNLEKAPPDRSRNTRRRA